MENEEDLFSEYNAERTIRGRVKDPKTWVNLLILIVIIFMAVILVKSVMGSWSKEEIKKSIKIIDFSSKWVIKNVGFSGEGARKEVSIIPQVTFKIKNIGKRDLEYVRFLGNFVYAEKRVVSIGDGYFDILKNSSLKPGQISDTVSIRSTYGYKTTTTSNETYDDMFFKKKGWKKFNVRISARIKGTVKEIAEYPVKNFIDNIVKKSDPKNAEQKNIKKPFKDIIIKNFKSEWRRVEEADGNLFIPTITFQLSNSGIKEFEKLNLIASFEFDDNKGVISQWKGKKNVSIELLSNEKISNSIYIEAENGIRATSVQKLFMNKVEWQNVTVKIYIGSRKIKPLLIQTLKIGQNVKGYRVREKKTL